MLYFVQVITQLHKGQEFFETHCRTTNDNCVRFGTMMVCHRQDVFPMRLKALHVVNEPSVFSTIFAIVKPFLKEKTVKRVCIIILSVCLCSKMPIEPRFNLNSSVVTCVMIINIHALAL